MNRLLIKILLLGLFAPLIGVGSTSLAGNQTSRARGTFPASKKAGAAKSHGFKIRTITAGVNLRSTSDLAAIESSIEFLRKAKKKFEDEGYEIQTLRIATQPLPEYLNGKSRREALADLRKIDEVITARCLLLSIGPVITDDHHHL